MKNVRCARFFKSKKQQCNNVGVVNYVHYYDVQGIFLTYSLCRSCSPNITKENKKKLGDTLFK